MVIACLACIRAGFLELQGKVYFNPDGLTQVCNSSTWGLELRQKDCPVFKAILSYIMSSRGLWAAERDSLKNKTTVKTVRQV